MTEPPKSPSRRTQRRGPRPSDDWSSGSVFSLSEEETQDLGRILARSLKGGELVLLEGELGMGKTVFTRGICVGLGIAAEDVSSPSFTLVQEYRGGRVPMFHVDLYRIDSSDEIPSLGLEEILAANAVVVVEWGEKLPSHLGRGAITVRFHDVGEGSRRIELLGLTPAASERRGDA